MQDGERGTVRSATPARNAEPAAPSATRGRLTRIRIRIREASAPLTAIRAIPVPRKRNSARYAMAGISRQVTPIRMRPGSGHHTATPVIRGLRRRGNAQFAMARMRIPTRILRAGLPGIAFHAMMLRRRDAPSVMRVPPIWQTIPILMLWGGATSTASPVIRAVRKTDVQGVIPVGITPCFTRTSGLRLTTGSAPAGTASIATSRNETWFSESGNPGSWRLMSQPSAEKASCRRYPSHQPFPVRTGPG